MTERRVLSLEDVGERPLIGVSLGRCLADMVRLCIPPEQVSIIWTTIQQVTKDGGVLDSARAHLEGERVDEDFSRAFLAAAEGLQKLKKVQPYFVGERKGVLDTRGYIKSFFSVYHGAREPVLLRGFATQKGPWILRPDNSDQFLIVDGKKTAPVNGAITSAYELKREIDILEGLKPENQFHFA